MMRRVIRAVDEHWFGSLPGFYLSLARVVVFGGLLFFLVAPFPFGEPGLLARQDLFIRADSVLYGPIPALKLLLLPFGQWGTVRPSPEFLQAAWLIAVGTAVGSVLGIRARLNMLCCAATATLIYAHIYSYNELHHPEAAMIIALWVLALGPITGAGSWEHFFARAREVLRTRQFLPRMAEADARPLIRWPLRLIQWVIVLTYFSAGISKLVNGGLDWFNGHTLAYYLAQDGIKWLDAAGPGMWLAQHPSILSLLSVGTVLFELTFVLAVLFPRIAWVYVAGGTALHIGIYMLQRAPFFQFIVLYIVFAEALRLTLTAAPVTTKRVIAALWPSPRREARDHATQTLAGR